MQSEVTKTDFQTPGNLPFEVTRPAEQRVPFVFNSPHSGRQYPASLLESSRLSSHALRRSEDVLVDELFSSVVEIGAPLLRANFPRCWLDVNREPYELDPLLFNERLPGHANSRSMRVAGGLGTIPRLVSENQPIYQKAPQLSDALWRIENVYRPYHDALRKLIARTAVRFGHCVLVDCHSMPSRGGNKEQGMRPDIIIGDRYGTSCHGDISQELVRGFTQLGYSATSNKPYAGGFITEHYGRPLKGLHTVQIEINRALYMDEQRIEPNANFDAFRMVLNGVIAQIADIGRPADRALAAE